MPWMLTSLDANRRDEFQSRPNAITNANFHLEIPEESGSKSCTEFYSSYHKHCRPLSIMQAGHQQVPSFRRPQRRL